MMKASPVLFIALFALAISASPSVEEEAPETFLEEVSAVSSEFQEATDFLQKKGSNACKDLADATEKEVKDNIAVEQATLNKINTGKDCPNEGQQAVKDAKAALQQAKDAKKAADKALVDAKGAKVNFGDFTFSALNKNNCQQFFGTSAHTNAEAKVKAAQTTADKAAGGVSAAKTAVTDAEAAAKKEMKACQCKAYTNHKNALNQANSDAQKANIAAWTKAAHLKCVLAGTSYNSCSVPTLPKVTAVTLAPGVDASKCADYPLGTTTFPLTYPGMNGGAPQCHGAAWNGSGELKRTSNGNGWYFGCFSKYIVKKSDLPVKLEFDYLTGGGSSSDNYNFFGFDYVANNGQTKPHYDCDGDFYIRCNLNAAAYKYNQGCQKAVALGSCGCGTQSRWKINIAEDGTVNYYKAAIGSNSWTHCLQDPTKATNFPMIVDATMYGQRQTVKNVKLTTGL